MLAKLVLKVKKVQLVLKVKLVLREKLVQLVLREKLVQLDLQERREIREEEREGREGREAREGREEREGREAGRLKSGLVPWGQHERMTWELRNPSGGLALVGFFLLSERVLVTRGMYEGRMTGPQQAGGFFTTYFSLRQWSLSELKLSALAAVQGAMASQVDDCTGLLMLLQQLI